jgi:predicted CopG family antitoxin
MELKNIKIDEDIWWELNKLKVKFKLKKISEVIKKLVNERDMETN